MAFDGRWKLMFGRTADSPALDALYDLKSSIGPFRGGRSLTAAGIPGDPTTYYFGATGGGVWTDFT